MFFDFLDPPNHNFPEPSRICPFSIIFLLLGLLCCRFFDLFKMKTRVDFFQTRVKRRMASRASCLMGSPGQFPLSLEIATFWFRGTIWIFQGLCQIFKIKIRSQILHFLHFWKMGPKRAVKLDFRLPEFSEQQEPHR